MKYNYFITHYKVIIYLQVQQARLERLKARIWPPGHSLPLFGAVPPREKAYLVYHFINE